jgi:hypothetical protein
VRSPDCTLRIKAILTCAMRQPLTTRAAVISFVLTCAVCCSGDAAPQGDLVEAAGAHVVASAQQPSARSFEHTVQPPSDDDDLAAPAAWSPAAAARVTEPAPAEPGNPSDRPARVRRPPPRSAGALHL